MDWGFYLLVAVLSTGLGFVGGHVALASDRRRRRPDATDPPDAAAFALEHADGLTWSLLNVGSAPGSLVRVLPLADGVDQWPPQPGPGHLETATSELLPTLAPGDSMSLWLSRFEEGQRVLVSWTSTGNVRMGPVAIEVPAPR